MFLHCVSLKLSNVSRFLCFCAKSIMGLYGMREKGTLSN